jgi:hypothetical protein
MIHKQLILNPVYPLNPCNPVQTYSLNAKSRFFCKKRLFVLAGPPGIEPGIFRTGI